MHQMFSQKSLTVVNFCSSWRHFPVTSWSLQQITDTYNSMQSIFISINMKMEHNSVYNEVYTSTTSLCSLRIPFCYAGTLLVQHSRPAEGEVHLRKALELNPHHAGAANNLKVALYDKKVQLQQRKELGEGKKEQKKKRSKTASKKSSSENKKKKRKSTKWHLWCTCLIYVQRVLIQLYCGCMYLSGFRCMPLVIYIQSLCICCFSFSMVVSLLHAETHPRIHNTRSGCGKYKYKAGPKEI